ncbi:MAG: tetratricopeptide repeat protein [Sedimentisphaerales bacterium]|nr:tetratricopeptide repeat protein [Sedimentisphaerales bacterium]
MTKRKATRRRGPRKPRARRTKPPIRAARPKKKLVIGAVLCGTVAVVCIAAALLWRTRHTPHAEQTQQTPAPQVPTEQSVSDESAESAIPVPEPPAEPALSPEEWDRALREEQMAVARELAAALPDDSNAAFLMGMAALEQGDVELATQHLQRALELQPNRADAYDHLGRTAFLQGDYDKAAAMFQKALEIDPTAAGSYFRLGKALLFLRRHAEAIEALQKDIELTPQPGESHCLLGEAYLQLQQYQKARDHYEAAIRIKPDFAKAYYGLATACARLGLAEESQGARAKFKELEAEDRRAGRHWRRVLDPLQGTRESVAHTHTDIGRVYRARGDLDRARQLWEKAASIDPNNVVCRFELATLHLQQQRPLDALKLHRELTRIDPNNGVSHYFIGTISAQLNRFDDAEAAYKKVIEVAPQRADGYRALAQLYLQINRDPGQARSLAARAVQREPSALNYSVLAAACDHSGDRTGALAALEQALRLEPGNDRYRTMYDAIKRRP